MQLQLYMYVYCLPTQATKQDFLVWLIQYLPDNRLYWSENWQLQYSQYTLKSNGEQPTDIYSYVLNCAHDVIRNVFKWWPHLHALFRGSILPRHKPLTSAIPRTMAIVDRYSNNIFWQYHWIWLAWNITYIFHRIVTNNTLWRARRCGRSSPQPLSTFPT